ncbi:MAG: hypothetical protein IPJ05_01920 [Nitrosomonas sp.]|nr:hypothetical protein [Nitrosomonas sp.]
MIHSFKFIKVTQIAFTLLLVCMLLIAKDSYSFQSNPIVFTRSGIWHATPEESCHYWASRRDIENVGLPTSQQAEIKSVWTRPWGWNPTNLTMVLNSLPAILYDCGVRYYDYGSPPIVLPSEREWHFGGATPVCKVGEWPSNLSSDKICNIPDHIPDIGANLGQPSTCVGNPINAATGNKFDQQIDIALPTFTFSRFYNSFGFFE